MFLNLVALLTAISISAVAAYYSIVGLTAVFSGAFWPIVIMGSALEIGKIVATVWLHTYWNDVKLFLRVYMASAVVVLMFVTSMGIFGFLSRAHIEVTSQVGGSSLLIAQLEQTISIEQKRIDDTRLQIQQMDNAVTGLLQSSATNAVRDNNRTAQLTQQASKLRQGQKKERDTLNAAIDNTNTRIAELNGQKLKLQQAQAKLEAEVGPIKYIAQLIYGDEINKDLLERAVRWVIIIIVAVFDPLAVCMILGVTMVMNRRKSATIEKQIEIVEKIVEVEKPIIEYKVMEVEKIIEVEKIVEVIKEITIERPVEKIVEVEKIVKIFVKDSEVSADLTAAISRADQAEIELAEVLTEIEKLKAIEPTVVEKIIQVPVIEHVSVVEERLIEDSAKLTELSNEISKLLVELDAKNSVIESMNSLQQQIKQATRIEEDNPSKNVEVSFGIAFPETPTLGQMFLRVDTLPSKLFKWNGSKWIAVDKKQNTSYTTDKKIIELLINKLKNNELDWEDLTEAEQYSIKPYLAKEAYLGR